MTEIDVLKEILTSKESQEDVLSFLGGLEKHGTAIDMILKIIDRIEKSPITPAILRGIGKKFDIDVETPLQSKAGILPKTEVHKAFFTELNKFPEEAIQNIAIMIQEKVKEAKNDKSTNSKH